MKFKDYENFIERKFILLFKKRQAPIHIICKFINKHFFYLYMGVSDILLL